MNANVLQTTIRRAGRATLAAEVLGAFARTIALIGACLLVAVGLDVAMALDAWALIVVDAAAAGLVLGAGVYLAWVAYRNRHQPRRLARLIERVLGIKDNALINAVDLAEQGGRATSQSLRQAGIARGEATAATVAPRRVIDIRRLRKALAIAAAALLAIAAAATIVPGAFRAAVIRYADPLGDHPPFTLVAFDVTAEPAKIYLGHSAVIRAALSSPVALPQQAGVVFVDPRSGRRQNIPMLRVADGQFVLNIERAEESADFYVSTPAGRSRRYRMVVHAVPGFKRVVVDYAFPAYTHWAPASAVQGENTQWRAIKGTRATITVESNLPLRQGLLTITPPGKGSAYEIVLKPTANRAIVRGDLEFAASARYRLAITSAEGVEGNETVEGTIACIADAPPQVSFASPGGMVLAPEHWKVPVAIVARDDVGVARIRLARSINGWGPSAVDLGLKASRPDEATAEAVFDLGALGARGGDVITYFATAYDTHPSPAQFSETPVQVIRVITREEYLQHARRALQMEKLQGEIDEFLKQMEGIEAQRDQLARDIQALQDKIAQAGKCTPEDLEKLRRLNEELKDYAAANEELVRRMQQRIDRQSVYDFEDQIKAALAKAKEDFARQGAAARGVAALPPKDQAGAGEFMKNALAALKRPEAPQVALTAKQLDLMRQADEMAGLVEQISSVARQQRDLADRLAQFSNKEQLDPTEEIRARRMAAEQTELRRQMLQAMEQLKAKGTMSRLSLPKMSASVLKLVQEIEGLDVAQNQADAAQLAQAAQGRYAYREADQAAIKLESLIKECCDNPTGDASDDLDGSLGLTRQKLSQALQQLSQGRSIPGMSQGGNGMGYQGSMTTVTLMGPHMGKGNLSAGRRGLGQAKTGPPVAEQPSGGAETLAPDARTDQDANAAAMPGVPTRFRSLAERYFRRLADESK
ncbi:MAG: hypothetical protein ABFD92_07175 [Planctomycetaceae bacterium]|nr:hypothetical protein [Planctomycetaceae bacterium]